MLAWVLLTAILIPGKVSFAQDPPRGTWKSWAFGKNRNPPRSLLILPNAAEAAADDRARENARQRAEDRLFFDKIKFERLLFYRTERERAVSARIAREAAKSAFDPPRKTTAPRPAPLAIGNESGEVDTPASPAFVGAPDKSAPPPRDPVQAIDDFIDRTTQQLTGSPANAPARSGIYVVLIVAMFLVPSLAVAFLFLAVSHLRARIWGRGIAFATLGCFILWGALAMAQMIILPSAGVPGQQPHWMGQLLPEAKARAD